MKSTYGSDGQTVKHLVLQAMIPSCNMKHFTMALLMESLAVYMDVSPPLLYTTIVPVTLRYVFLYGSTRNLRGYCFFVVGWIAPVYFRSDDESFRFYGPRTADVQYDTRELCRK